MPNFEELYYDARSKYYNAIENRNRIQRETSELQGRKNCLINNLNQRQADLRDILNKLTLLQDAENKCKTIICNEFESMKKFVQATAEEYKKIVSSDKGVVDIQAVYIDDINNTRNDLGGVLFELEQRHKEYEEQMATVKLIIEQCGNELDNVSHRLSNVGSVSYAQSQVNNYYAQMKEYQRRWEAGC